jgi:hypothetical protein
MAVTTNTGRASRTMRSTSYVQKKEVHHYSMVGAASTAPRGLRSTCVIVHHHVLLASPTHGVVVLDGMPCQQQGPRG